MKTLRQEIEKLISDLTKMHIERRDHPNDYVRGRGDGIELAVDNLTDILSRHHEEPAATSQRERIADIYLEESKVNRGSMILIAIDENGQKWVCSGDHWSPTYAKKYEDAFDTKPLEGNKQTT